VKKAMLGEYKTVELYSGESLRIPCIRLMDYELIHEIAHCYNENMDLALDEAVADRIACQKLMGLPEGEKVVAALVSGMMVEANLLGYGNFSDLRQIRLPYPFSDGSIRTIQHELDDYHSDPEKSRLKYQKKKKAEFNPFAGSEDIYSEGFVQLLGK
jgi:hypothetical protein